MLIIVFISIIKKGPVVPNTNHMCSKTSSYLTILLSPSGHFFFRLVAFKQKKKKQVPTLSESLMVIQDENDKCLK